MESTVLRVHNAHERFADLTAEVAAFCEPRGDGLVSVFVPHATAGVAIIETGSGTEPDLEAMLDRLLPRDDRYRHRHGAVGHGADHVLPAVIAPSVTVPVLAGTLMLGTWQSIVLVDLNVDNPERTVRLSFIAG